MLFFDFTIQITIILYTPLIGLRCAFAGEEQHDETLRQAVVCGEYQLVYMSPESLLGVLQWREMFCSSIYQECLVAIAVDEHLVEKW